jgi:ketosteroid isomerase-like protein
MAGSDADLASILRAVWAAYATGDRAGTLEHFSDSVSFGIYVPQEVLPFGGETHGKAAMSDRLQTVYDQFEIVQYTGTVLNVSENTARGQVAYIFRHKWTGEALEGKMRLLFEFDGPLIVRLQEFHDVEMVRAFMRLIAYRV